MLKPKPNEFSKIIFLYYLKKLFGKNFRTIEILNSLPNLNPSLPLLVLPNHSNWWDGLVYFYLFREYFKKNLHLMMSREQLNRHRFFQRLGAFSISPNKPREITQSISLAAAVLRNSTNAVVIFPQGALLPFDPPVYMCETWSLGVD